MNARPRIRYYIYERISKKNYRLKGSILAVDAYDAATLWTGTKVKKTRWRKLILIGISGVRCADKNRRVPAAVIEYHFTYLHYGW